jgi:hypothetical protein
MVVQKSGAAVRAELHLGNDVAPAATAPVDVPGPIFVRLELRIGPHLSRIGEAAAGHCLQAASHLVELLAAEPTHRIPHALSKTHRLAS